MIRSKALLIGAFLLAYYTALIGVIYYAPTVVSHLTGASLESGPIYGFWSGFGGTLIFSAMVLFPPWYFQHSCHHDMLCLNWGRYPMAGGLAKVCRKHHPDIDESKPIHEELHRLHLEWKNNGSPDSSSV